MFEEYIVAESPFSLCLGGGTVDAETDSFVFPCDIIGPLGVEASGGKTRVYMAGIGCADSVDALRAGCDIGRKQQKTVVGNLRGNLTAGCIGDINVVGSQTLENGSGRDGRQLG